MYHQVETFINSAFCPVSVFRRFVWMSEQTAIIWNRINFLHRK